MNVLFIDIDTLRPDHMGCYGYGRNTTPNIDAMEKMQVGTAWYFPRWPMCASVPPVLATGSM